MAVWYGQMISHATISGLADPATRQPWTRPGGLKDTGLRVKPAMTDVAQGRNDNAMTVNPGTAAPPGARRCRQPPAIARAFLAPPACRGPAPRCDRPSAPWRAGAR